MNDVSNKQLNIKMDKKTFLTIYIFIQMILHLLAFKAIGNTRYNIIEYISIFLVLVYSFVVFIVILLNNKNKYMISYYCISTILLSFLIIFDLDYLKKNQIHDKYIYIQIVVLFIMLDVTLKILAHNISKGLFYKYIVIFLWAIGVVLGISRKDIYALIYQVTFLIINIYPILFLMLNYKKIKNYARYLFPTLFLLIFGNIIFILWAFVIDMDNNGNYNYDLYIYLNLMEIGLSYFVLSALGFWKIVKNKKINIKTLILAIFIGGYLYFGREQLISSLFCVISIVMIIEEYRLLNHYTKLFYHEKTNKDYIQKSDLFENMIEKNILDFKKEELYKEQVADFLHDEILQDAICIKKELQDHYKIKQSDKIFEIADSMISKTRSQINLYKPHIDYKNSISENYYNLIKSLKSRFNTTPILIDFICDDKLFLSPPYDLVIYRMIHELITNIFKHSKGEYSIIELDVKNNEIILNITSYGDYFEDNSIINTDSRGLKIIKREVDRFRGVFKISSSIDSNILIDKEISENSIVNIKIEIPIEGGITYENFINR